MKSKQVKLLQNQINKLRSDSFDLEAWKSATEICLRRIFGENDSRIQQIHGLKIDYGSWALRDAQGDYNPLKTCKKKGEEILQAAIDEIEILGLPSGSSNDIMSCFEDGLKISELKNLIKVLNSSKDEKKVHSEVRKLLKTWKPDTQSIILEMIIIKNKKDFLNYS